MDDFKDVGIMVKYYRNKKGYTQAELAEKSDMSEHQVYMIESGARGVSVKRLVSLANALGIGTDALLSGGLKQITANNASAVNMIMADCSRKEISFLTQLLGFVKKLLRE